MADVSKLMPPPNGRVHVVCVPVIRGGREWNEAIDAVDPQTSADWDIRKVGGFYPPIGFSVIGDKDIALVNLGILGGDWFAVNAWAVQYGLDHTDPRYAFAIGEHFPGLNHILGMDEMYVLATVDCPFAGLRQLCGVYWRGAKREVRLFWLGVNLRLANVWFVFQSRRQRLPD